MAENQITVSDDIVRGIDTARRAARTTRAAGKAVTKAAAGNIAGAVIEVVKDPGLLEFTAFVLAACFALSLMVIFFVPMSLYNAVLTIGDKVDEAFYETYYEGNQDRYIALQAANSAAFIEFFKQGVKYVRSLFSSPVGGDVEDAFDPADTMVFSDFDVATDVYKDCIEAIQEKFDDRAESLKPLITNIILEDINPWVEDNLFPSEKAKYEGENVEINYDGVKPIISTAGLTKRDAVDLLALYSVMNNVDYGAFHPYELKRWMGYKDSGMRYSYDEYGDTTLKYDDSVITRRIYFTIGGAYTAYVDAWQGSFMPMYLTQTQLAMQESDPSADLTAEYGIGAVDLLIRVISPDRSMLTPNVSKTMKYEVEYTYEQKWAWVLMTGDRYIQSGYGDKEAPEPQGIKPHGITPSLRQQGYDYFWVPTVEAIPNKKEITVYSISYDYNVTISHRNVKDLVKIAGLYELDPYAKTQEESGQ